MSEELINQVSAEETAESTVNIDQNKYIVINAPNADKIVSVHEEGGQDGLLPSGGTTGQVVTKKSDKDFDVEWVDASSGVVDYTELENKPSINNVTLEGNKTSSELGLQSTIIKEKSTDSSNGIFNLTIDDSSESAAVSVKIRGNIFPVWQLIDPNLTPTTVTTQAGRCYYSYINGEENVFVSTGETIQGDVENGDIVYDLTFSRFTAEEVVDLETFKEAWYKKSGIPFTNNLPFTYDRWMVKAGLFDVVPDIAVLGRNLFNEEVTSDGAGGWVSSDKIYITPNTTYYITSPFPIRCEFINWWDNTIKSIETVQNGEVVAPSDANLLNLRCLDHEYAGGVCVNVSDPNFNGTCEPYTQIGSIYDEDIHLWGIDDIKDEFNVTTGDITCRIGRRAYEEGDELDTSVVTDFEDTYYVLSEPTIETVDAYKLNLSSEYNEIISFASAAYNDGIFPCFGDISIKYYDKDFVIPSSSSIPYYEVSSFEDGISTDFIQEVIKNRWGILAEYGEILYYPVAVPPVGYTGAGTIFFTDTSCNSLGFNARSAGFDLETGAFTGTYGINSPYPSVYTLQATSGTLSLGSYDKFNYLLQYPEAFTLKFDVSLLSSFGLTSTVVSIPYTARQKNRWLYFSTTYYPNSSLAIVIGVRVYPLGAEASTYEVFAHQIFAAE